MNSNNLNINSTPDKLRDNNYNKLRIFRNNKDESSYNESSKNKSIYSNLPVIAKYPPSINKNNFNTINIFSRNDRSLAVTNHGLNIFSNETIRTVFKRKNFHLYKLKNYLRNNAINKETINNSIFINNDPKKINYIQLSADFNLQKIKPKIYSLNNNIFDNNDTLKTDFPFTSRSLKQNIYNQTKKENRYLPILPPIENLLKSHLKMYTPKKQYHKDRNFVKEMYLKTIINKSLKDSCKSLNIKNYNNEIWITDCNKNKTDEKKYDNILFKNTKIYNKVMKSTNNEKNNSFKNKTIEEMKQNNLKRNKREMERIFDDYSDKKKYIYNYLERSKKEFDKFDVCMSKENEDNLYEN